MANAQFPDPRAGRHGLENLAFIGVGVVGLGGALVALVMVGMFAAVTLIH